MIYLFYIGVGFILIIIQTAIIPSIFSEFYDLLLPLILFMGAHKSMKKGIPIVILFGLLMDALSGGAFGLYTVIYLWLLLFVRWITVFLHVHSTALLVLLLALGTLVENFFFIITANDIDSMFDYSTIRLLVIQLICAIITSPFILIILNKVQVIIETKDTEQKYDRFV